MLLAASPALLLAGTVIQRVSTLFPGTLPDTPYWVPSHAVLLYVGAPLVVAATVVMLLAPGTLLVVGYYRLLTLQEAISRGFVLSFAIVSVIAAIASRTFAEPSLPFSGALVVANSFAWAWCVRRGGRLAEPDSARRRLAMAVGLPAVATALILPVVFWQDFNPDGLELLTMGRSLNDFVIPRLPSGNLSGLGLGMVASAYPVHWFLTIAGATEAAARLPVLVMLPLIFLGFLGLIEADRGPRLGLADEVLVLLGTLVVVATLVFNSTYHPYSADPASPAGIDLLAAVCLLGMLSAYAADTRGWFVAYLLLGYFARPVALLICGLLLVAQALCDRPRLAKRALTLILGIGLCVAVAFLYEKAAAAWLQLGVDEPSNEMGARRLRWIVFFDWRRLAYVVVPAGFFPVVSLAAVRFQDPFARVCAATAALYLLFFWFPAFSALHHYLPATILVIVVHWRVLASFDKRTWRVASLVGIAVAFGCALPRSFVIDRTSRATGAQIDWGVGRYLGDLSERQRAFDSKHLLEALFPAFATTLDPDRSYTAGAWVLVHYASTAPRARDINYLVRPNGETAATPWSLVLNDDTGSVWVRDREKWRYTLSHPPPTGFRSAVFATPRTALLPVWGVPAGRFDLDIRSLIDRVKGP